MTAPARTRLDGRARAPDADGFLPAACAPDFDAVSAIADRALVFARAHRTPPTPKIYEVWYSYAEGADRAVAERVDALLRRNGRVAAYDLLQVQAEQLAAERREREGIEEANSRLERELANVLGQVQAHVDSSETYCGTLAERGRRLDESSVASIRWTIETLIADNRAMRAETHKLAGSLKQSQAQIHNLRSALRKARESELTDPLTGISNRRGFQLRIASEMERAMRDGTPLSLVLADLDHFKNVNDRFGHLIGDEVLRFFAATISRNVDEGGLASRYGGEEFAILMPDTDLARACERAEAMRRSVEAARLYVAESREQIGRVTASFGVAEFAIEDDFASLVRRADHHLYEAKNGGRNRVAAAA